MAFKSDVVIAGAGPCGLFLAARLIRLGIRVTILEKETELNPAIRALGYYGPLQNALERAGVYDEVKKAGFLLDAFSWRKMPKLVSPDRMEYGELIASWKPWEFSDLKEGDIGWGMLVLGQGQLREIILPHLLRSDLATVHLGHEVVEFSQDENSAAVTAIDVATGTRKQFTGSFVVGADGGKSVTRKLMGQSAEGFTWPQVIIATDICVELQPPKDGPPIHYLIDPVCWAFMSPVSNIQPEGPNLYRCTFPMDPDECEPEVFDEFLRKKLELIVPGPRPLKYEIKRAQPYRIHQRQVKDYVVGRGILVGDAAHLNIPWGGLGLTTGLLDTDSLAYALEYMINDGKPLSVLKLWGDARHAVWKDIVDPVSKMNKERCHNTNPENPKEDPFLRVILEDPEGRRKLNGMFDDMQTDMAKLLSGEAASVKLRNYVPV